MSGHAHLRAREPTPRRLNARASERAAYDPTSELVVTLVEAQDVTGLVRLAFERDRPEDVLRALAGVARAKEGEIQSVCRDYSDEFISSMDELGLVKEEVQGLKRQVRAAERRAQRSAFPKGDPVGSEAPPISIADRGAE